MERRIGSEKRSRRGKGRSRKKEGIERRAGARRKETVEVRAGAGKKEGTRRRIGSENERIWEEGR